MSDWSKILEQAKWGRLEPSQVDDVARALEEGEGDPYTLIHILGRAGATQHEELVAEFLDCEEDPMCARIALVVLVDHWGLFRKYRSRVFEFLRGIEWDVEDEGQVQLVAISSAGEFLRTQADRELLTTLRDLFNDARQPDLTRGAAYRALVRIPAKPISRSG